MEFFSSGSILKQINHTVIALVPKSSQAPSVGDYMPISCCNVIYKVITKILASRLRPILGDIVDQARVAFIEGRSMTKNIHLSQELMRQYNRKRVTPRCLLKIDIRKAYDSLSLDFLKGVLEGLYFPSRFIQCDANSVSKVASEPTGIDNGSQERPNNDQGLGIDPQK
ncbi:uncharacterized protein LOC111389190 [Olea europaea var. sylvestris]|uniref:uncharacterized protein LOC111389190 n=1 Tax=Olea europaea var. sylvestris TaxID=158386 RepID=UPI000C1D0C76|nr:uncharacterized protein LOC111389190 [Olea europaea var. sylvestris]